MRKLHLAIMIGVGLTFFAAGPIAGQPSWRDQPAVIKMIEEARISTKQVPLSELKKLWDEDADIVILDVRTPRERCLPREYGPPRTPSGFVHQG